MPANDMMRGFPPPADKQVSIVNWRQAPFNRWGLRNVRSIVPTAAVRRGTTVAPLAVRPRDVENIVFAGHGRREMTVRQFLDETFTDGFLVMHRGEIVAERYDAGLRPQDQHIIFSVTKSVSGTLAGVLVDRGLLDPEAPVARYVPEAKGSAYEKAKVRHVLDMTVGIQFVEDYTALTGDFVRYREATGWNPIVDPKNLADLRSFLVSLKPKGKHGDSFHYVSPCSDMLGWIMERASGIPFVELLSQEIWAPMGAEFDADMAVDRLGAPRTAGGLCVSLRDLGRFGNLMLNRGLAQGRQLVPAWWVDDCRENGDAEAWKKGEFNATMPNCRYRNKWYILDDDPGAFCGIGIHGQWLYINTQAQVVVCKLSSQPAASDNAMDFNAQAACTAIAQALRNA